MSRVCQITGKKAIVGNHVSHSNIKSKRRFNPNLHDKKFFVPELGGWVMLKVSAKGIRKKKKKGAWNAIVDAHQKGNLK
jgi:large subunit ribosomal protein L28